MVGCVLRLIISQTRSDNVRSTLSLAFAIRNIISMNNAATSAREAIRLP